MTLPARTIFLGSGPFAVPIVATLAQHPATELAAAVTVPAQAGSRGRLTHTPVALWAIDHGVPLLQPVRLRAAESVAQIAALAPELLVLADYGQIVPAAVLDIPRHGALNLHPSLLPRHRGAAPIPAAILAGDAQTGVTLMRMDAGLDTGPVVAQATRALDGTETTPELEAELAAIAAGLLGESLGAWLEGTLRAVAQDPAAATVTRPLRREDGRLDPRRSASDLERQVRAFQPWPGTFFDTSDGRVIVWRARPTPGAAPVGTVVEIDGSPAIGADDGLLQLVEVQPSGGRRMSGSDLLRGRRDLIGQSVI